MLALSKPILETLKHEHLLRVERSMLHVMSDLKLATKKRIAALKRTTTQTGGGQTDPIVLTPTEECGRAHRVCLNHGNTWQRRHR